MANPFQTRTHPRGRGEVSRMPFSIDALADWCIAESVNLEREALEIEKSGKRPPTAKLPSTLRRQANELRRWGRSVKDGSWYENT